MVLHHLDGLLLFAAAGLLHPAPGPGVHCVSRIPSPQDPKISWRAVLAPRSAWSLRSIPPSLAVPRHRGQCPLVVTSRLQARCSRGRTHSTSRLKAGFGEAIWTPVARGSIRRRVHREARFRAFLYRRVCGVQLAMKRYCTPSPSMGFGPLQGVLPDARCVTRSPRCRSNAPCEPPRRCDR